MPFIGIGAGFTAFFEAPATGAMEAIWYWPSGMARISKST
jgi:hypothetical protein